MGGGPSPQKLVGREAEVRRLGALLERVAAGQPAVALVSGEAGIGKTSLVDAVTAAAAARGVRRAWGMCLDGNGTPGYWPWTQALGGLVRAIGARRARELAGEDTPLLAGIVPALGESGYGETTDRTRLLLFDATARFLDTVSVEWPLVVVLDDLQWADESSLALFEFVAGGPHSGGLCLVGAYRHDELNPATRPRLSALVSRSHHVHLEGLGAGAVHELVQRLLDRPVDHELSRAIHRRTGGHPFFVREVALLPHDRRDAVEIIPTAVGELIQRRIRSLPVHTRALLEVAAVAGTDLVPDVAAAVLESPPLAVDTAARDAIERGVLVRSGDGFAFAHDLLREAILGRLDEHRRVELHQAIGAALEDRRERGAPVAPAEIARHLVAAVPLGGTDRAIRWALEAAASECGTLAFEEAAAHLRRLRAAVAGAGLAIGDDRLFDVLFTEADALARAGSPVDARGLLRAARAVAERTGHPDRIARVALATASLGARFASRRDEIVAELDGAMAAVEGTGPAWEAQLAAALARELQHSVPEDRPRAGPLSARALDLGRRAGDDATLAACLLARHDVLWTPGTAAERAELAREITGAAVAAGDDERRAEGLLLLANALLEQGTPAFEAALTECLTILDRLGQPRHRYLAQTRRACVALLHGELDEAAERIEDAARLGERLREPDAGNVAMSQRLELVRARGRPDELRAFAARAVEHWTGAPVHAHAVAAGFSARAGDVAAAHHHLATALDLGGWRADRSYLWSVFVRELACAAVTLDDAGLCAELLEQLTPLADSCGVNGAVVAFAGSHAHTAGLLAAALDQPDLASALLDRASATYQRLGATGWLAETETALAAAGRPAGAPRASASMRRRGTVWDITFLGQHATVPHSKGLADLARLLAVPGTDVHTLDLIGGADRSGPPGTVADRQALEAYRRRVADIDDELAEAERHNDGERAARLATERQAILDEVGRVTGRRARLRQFSSHPAERARKAVTARVRDAIDRLEPLLPDLAAHLQRTIVTGTYCRYRGESDLAWDIHATPGNRATTSS